MKFTAAILAFAAGALALKNNGTVVYETKVVTAITTFCPAPTQVTYGGSTYTITEATTLTISDCPCTIKVPVTTVSSVICHSCTAGYQNSTTVATQAPSSPAPTKSVGTVTLPAPSSTKPGAPIATAGAGRAAALSGGALAGVLGLAAFVL